MSYRAVVFRVQGFIILLCLQVLISTAVAADNCKETAGKLVSMQGEAQVLRNGQTVWDSVRMDDTFCPGDMLRVGAGGRVAVVLANETVLRIDQKSTLNFAESPVKHLSFLKLLNGVLHIFSHRPRSLNIATPYVNGAVEGTEFLVQTGPDNSIISVFEGLVRATNEKGQLAVSSGQTVIAGKGTAPEYMTVVRPRDATQWTLYYPAIIDLPAVEEKNSQTPHVRQAAENLAVGRVEEARGILAGVLEKDSANSEAFALQAIIEVVQNNKKIALHLASQAVAINPRSAAAGLALSYAQQACFDIPGALASLEKAEEFNPGNAEIKARLAEMQLSVGDLDKARVTAQEAVKLNPDVGRSQTVLGFAYLTRIETDKAQAAFKKAIALDPALPLARLGLGLARIRDGKLEEGRADIEIAAALDPDNALIRSYLGKAYSEEKRDSLSRRQYDIAKTLDPADPTPWFYDALRKQSLNRPVEALQDLQKSIALNDNRAVYRSRLLLDEDLAARSASLGRIYADLGFQQLALVEGWKSVNTDPANYSAHRFLADSYSALPRHEIARVSELLKSQLLQPLSVTPVQPQLAENNLFIQEGAGPADASFNEYTPLFLRNRMALQASGVTGGNDTLGDELVQSGVWNNFSYSLGQFHYQTKGIRENNDQLQNIYNAYFQGMLSPETSLISEFRFRKKTFGDLAFKFDQTDYSRTLQQVDELTSLRLGGRHDLHPDSTLIGTAIISSDDNNAAGIDGATASMDITNQSENIMAEVQHLYKGPWFNLQSGAGFLSADETESIKMVFPEEVFSEKTDKTLHTNIYSYGQIDMSHRILATIGLSGDIFDSPVEEKNELNPKIGLTWQPLKNTMVRVAAFKTLQRRLIYAQTIEPTQLAGFNQFFNDFEAASVWNCGIGLDQKFSDTWFGGIQYFYRNLEVPFTVIDPIGTSEVKEDEWQEKIGSAFLYWAPYNWTALGVEYYYEADSHEQWEGPQGIQNLTTHRVTPQIHFFHPCGLGAKIQVSYVEQEGDFGSTFFGFKHDDDHFWIVDLSLSYRLPKRYGILKLEVKNLFDEQFQFLDTDPGNPRFLPEQQILGSLTVAF